MDRPKLVGHFWRANLGNFSRVPKSIGLDQQRQPVFGQHADRTNGVISQHGDPQMFDHLLSRQPLLSIRVADPNGDRREY